MLKIGKDVTAVLHVSIDVGGVYVVPTGWPRSRWMINHSLGDNYTFVMLLSLRLSKRQGRSYKRGEKSLQGRREASNNSDGVFFSQCGNFLVSCSYLSTYLYVFCEFKFSKTSNNLFDSLRHV